MATTPVTLFKNQHGNVNVALYVNGAINTVAFVQGKFFTTDVQLQAALQRAADSYEFGIYVDPADDSIDPEFATPLDQLKKKLREEILAEMKAGGKLVDGGVSAPGSLQSSMTSTEGVVGAGELSEEAKELKEQQLAALKAVEAAKAVPEEGGALSALEKLKLGNLAK